MRVNSDGTLYVRVDQIIFTPDEAKALAHALEAVAAGKYSSMFSTVEQLFGDLND